MKTFIQLVLLVSSLVAATSTALRGVVAPAEDDKQVITHRQLQESTCTLYRKCVTYLPTKEHPNGYHQDSWACELSDEDSKNMGVTFVDIVQTDFVAAKIGNATSGKATMTISEAIVDTKSPRMFIPHDASVTIGSRPLVEDGRRLSNGPSTTGTLNTLVIRVLDKNNVAPTLSIAKLRNDVFNDGASLKTQTAACSGDKVQIKPFVGRTPSNKQVTNGIVEVKMDYTMGSNAPGLDQAAMNAANEQLGNLNDSMFDLVLFCFPPGNNFLAFAYPNSKFSFYNDQFCGFVGAQMHEVGHNLGLAHSGQINESVDYGDVTGVMGAVPGGDDLRMCYNPQKNYQLGWYNDQVETIDPLDGVGKREYVLNGVVDYNKNQNALVVLRLRQTELQGPHNQQQDFYIGFNRATGINADTAEDRDMVTVLRKEYGSPEEYGISTKMASLSVGQTTVIENFNGQRDIEIKFEGITNGRDAKITVTDANPTVTYPNGSCEEYTVEIKTDGYPQDNSWYINDSSGNKKFGVDSFPTQETVYTETVCLNHNSNYEFVMVDTYADGMCCEYGNGYYKVTDSKGTVVVDSQQKEEAFGTQTATINVGAEKECKNFRGKFKLSNRNKKARRCAWYARRDKCNKTVQSHQVPVWQLCPKACDACDRI